MCEDTPDDLVFEQMTRQMFTGALGRSVLGTKENLTKMTSEDLFVYLDSHYTAENLLISVSGSFTDTHKSLICETFSAAKKGTKNQIDMPEYSKTTVETTKEIEQNHICLAFPAFEYSAPERYAFQVFNGILGAGMSSRLFQRIREQLGLCYSVYSFPTTHTDIGSLGIYTATNAATEEKVVANIISELEKFKNDGITADELEKSREQIKSGFLLSLENTQTRMSYNAKSELFFGRVISDDDLANEYDKITTDDVLQIAAAVLNLEKMSFSAVRGKK